MVVMVNHHGNFNHQLVGSWALSLWKIWLRQLGWWHSQSITVWKNKNCSKPPTRFSWSGSFILMILKIFERKYVDGKPELSPANVPLKSGNWFKWWKHVLRDYHTENQPESLSLENELTGIPIDWFLGQPLKTLIPEKVSTGRTFWNAGGNIKVPTGDFFWNHIPSGNLWHSYRLL